MKIKKAVAISLDSIKWIFGIVGRRLVALQKSLSSKPYRGKLALNSF